MIQITSMPNSPKGCHVDDKPLFHIALQQAFVSLVDLLDSDQFYVGGDPLLAAEIKHLLRLANSPDRRTRQLAALRDQAERSQSGGFRWRADQRHRTVQS